MVDQRTCSEHLITTAFPVNKEAIMGDQALFKADVMFSKQHRYHQMTRTIVPGDDSCNNAKWFEMNFRFFVAHDEISVS